MNGSPIEYDFMDDPDIEVRFNESLREYTTFKLGGPCRCLVTCSTGSQLANVMSEWAAEHEDYFVMGGGSNVLVSDNGYDGLVVRYHSESPFIEREGDIVTVAGSARLDQLVRFTVDEGFDGLVFASGIPGTVGGAVAGNAGAFGREMADVLEWVELIDADGMAREEEARALGFRYRSSSLHESRDVVAWARFRLIPGEVEELRVERERILAVRREKQPDWQTQPCAGSFFRNVQPADEGGERRSAGWLLEQAGVSGMRKGGAKVFEGHANIIVKDSDECTAMDVYGLAHDMWDAVRERFGIELVPEVRFLGRFSGLAELGAG